MWYYVKQFFKVVVSLFVILLVDVIVCYQTYYIPSLEMFVSYKYLPLNDKTPDYDLDAVVKAQAGQGEFWTVRMNYFTRTLYGARFVHGYPKRIDWLAMAPPGEIGCSYVINKQTKCINICKTPFGSDKVAAYNTVKLTVVDEPIGEGVLYERDKNAIPRTRVLELFIVIENSHWLLAHYFGSDPENGVQKAHLWHLMKVF